jgi:hypothetical protein
MQRAPVGRGLNLEVIAAHPIREQLATRLRARRLEIEQALMVRAYGVSEPPESAEPEYVEGLRAAVAAALDHGLAVLESGEEDAQPLPAVLLIQARLAARNGVQLGTVVRRYVAGYTMLGTYIAEEASASELVAGEVLNGLLRTQAVVFDRLVAAVSDEYTREKEDAQQRRSEHSSEARIQRLLGGEFLDTADIPYDFDAHHLGAIASGSAATQVIHELSNALDCRLLTVHRDDGNVWAWLGSRHRIDATRLERHASTRRTPVARAKVALAVGEVARGLAGWRFTHQQARAALPIALRSPKPFVRYADVALLSSMLQDDLLVASLRELYLAPLQQERDGGKAALQTLRAYIDAERNVTSAAAALGLNRNTVANRLRGIEKRIGRPFASCGLEIEAALRIEELAGTQTWQVA